VEVASAAVRNLADPGDFVMMVKDFSGVEMKLAGEQHAHNQGMHPEPKPVFPPASHFVESTLPWIGPKLPLTIDNTKKAAI